MTTLSSRLLNDKERQYFRWLEAPELQSLCNALEYDHPRSVRYVGGCVRDGLLGVVAEDIDIATSLKPEQVMDILLAAGIKTVPTGIEHGTVTAILGNRAVEITTLRRDVSTDGRRATIAYTNDWHLDAERRDFTINALYLAPDGTIYDPVGGLDDLANKRVRFIGNARERIAEDYLRILRFFRFSARFAPSFDKEGLQAAGETASGIKNLSRERVGSEFLKIIALPHADVAISAMIDANILSFVWPEPPMKEKFSRFKQSSPNARPLAALVALFGSGIAGLGKSLRLSNRQSEYLETCLKAQNVLADLADEMSAKAALYHLGSGVWQDGINLACADVPARSSILKPYMDLPDKWKIPVFPLSGQDILDAGLLPGPHISTILKMTEEKWVLAGFPAQEKARAILEEVLSSNK